MSAWVKSEGWTTAPGKGRTGSALRLLLASRSTRSGMLTTSPSASPTAVRRNACHWSKELLGGYFHFPSKWVLLKSESASDTLLWGRGQWRAGCGTSKGRRGSLDVWEPLARNWFLWTGYFSIAIIMVWHMQVLRKVKEWILWEILGLYYPSDILLKNQWCISWKGSKSQQGILSIFSFQV